MSISLNDAVGIVPFSEKNFAEHFEASSLAVTRYPRVLAEGRDSKKVTLGEVMTPDPIAKPPGKRSVASSRKTSLKSGHPRAPLTRVCHEFSHHELAAVQYASLLSLNEPSVP
jgi:hypothetical protein